MEVLGLTMATVIYLYLGGIVLTIAIIICYFNLCGRIKNIEKINSKKLEILDQLLKLEMMNINKKD